MLSLWGKLTAKGNYENAFNLLIDGRMNREWANEWENEWKIIIRNKKESEVITIIHEKKEKKKKELWWSSVDNNGKHLHFVVPLPVSSEIILALGSNSCDRMITVYLNHVAHKEKKSEIRKQQQQQQWMFFGFCSADSFVLVMLSAAFPIDFFLSLLIFCFFQQLQQAST